MYNNYTAMCMKRFQEADLCPDLRTKFVQVTPEVNQITPETALPIKS